VSPSSRITKAKRKIGGYIVRGAAVTVLSLCAVVGFSSAFTSSDKWSALPGASALHGSAAKPGTQVRPLTFGERVSYQRAIEEVYWRHRIWPRENGGAKPSLDKGMSQTQIEKKVEHYLRDSQTLENYWQRPITFHQLQAEMDRMAQHTKNPEMLRELFEALGNDPFVIAECLARPALSERLVSQFYDINTQPGSKPKQRGKAWLQSQSMGGQSDTATGSPVFAGYSLPAITDAANTCTDDTWSSLTDLPARRANHTAVWTGSEMIVFGGLNYHQPIGTGDRYNPATDSWSTVSLTNAPSARYNHSAVWTGKEMIVWGGETAEFIFGNGRNYDPANDSWTPTSSSNAPTARTLHTAVWTGTEMLVWGGGDDASLPNTGGRYDPRTDSWKTINTANAPEGRFQHSVIWTGSRMIIWGGRSCVDCYLSSGGKYNPVSDTWTGTSAINAPGARFGHSAVWTGSEAIIWGGWNGNALSDGARYNPTADAWTALSAINPPQARDSHSAVWTGSEMVVWGGNVLNDPSASNSGGRYNPAMNLWTPTSTTNAPLYRDTHTTIWTGSEMIVFGGGYGETFNTGARYDPKANTWTPVRSSNTPDGRYQHTAVWTGSEMIVWGGELNDTWATNTGGRYDPALDSWTPTSTANAPEGREAHTAVWTGTEIIVWGGWNSNGFSFFRLNTGGRYNPTTDHWTPTTLTNAPGARRYHSVVWTGSEMIVWGGEVSDPVNTGGRYNPYTDTWIATATSNAPDPRIDHSAVWTGTEMIVWGGGGRFYNDSNTGGRYNPSTNSWTATNTIGVSTRGGHSAIWTGKEMIVWGGHGSYLSNNFLYNVPLNTGARYNPSTDSWTDTTLSNAPEARGAHASVWTGQEMIVWGGHDSQEDRFLDTGGRYNPTTDRWTPTAMVNAPGPAEFPTAVWTGNQMIVWGGFLQFWDRFGQHNNLLSTGGRYCVQSTGGAQLGNISTRAFAETDANVMIGGFIVQGTGTKQVIIRAIGPKLAQYGVPSAMADPTLELHDGTGAVIARNDNWQTTIIGGSIPSNQASAIQSSGYAPGEARECAMIVNLAAGNYTAIVRGVNNTTGVALVEVYDLSSDASSILANISTRAFAETDANVMIGGFIVQGTGTKQVIVRAIGPKLAQYGVPSAMANPTLELHDGTGAVIARNDNWQTTIIGGSITSDQAGAIQSSGYAPGDARECAMIVNLAAGNYTAIVRGVNNTTGVALVEVYDRP
jgi:N-acetylneuraminic acid mutarotase/D-arabinose 5-phosphate isomerase GutQ